MMRQLAAASWTALLLSVAPAWTVQAAAAHDPARVPAAPPKFHDDPMLNQAIAAWANGDLDRAAAIGRDATVKHPDRFEYWNFLGRLQLQRGEDGPQIVRFGDHVSVRTTEAPPDAEKWRRDKLEEALKCFQKLVELRSDYAVGRGYQVICLMGLGRLTEAEAAARLAVQTEPKDPEWRAQLAVVLRMNEKLDDAAKELDAGESLAPRSSSVAQERFRLAQARKLPAEQLEVLRLRAAFFTFLIPAAVSEFTPDRGRVVTRFVIGRSGLRGAEEVPEKELLATIHEQAKQPDDFTVDLWISVLHRSAEEDEVVRAVVQALEAAGPAPNERLFWVMMNSPNSMIAQRHAARLLARGKQTQIFEPLTKFLPYDTEVVAVEAATALGLLGDVRAVGPLCQVCQGPAVRGNSPSDAGIEMNRRRCVTALRYFDTPESLQTLQKMAADAQMRSTALASLYVLTRDRKRLDELAAMLVGPKADFRAVHDLASLDQDDAWRIVLERGASSSDDQVRAHTARAIRYAAPDEARRATFAATLQTLARDKVDIVAGEARRALEKLNGKAN